MKGGVCSHLKTLISEGWKIDIDKSFPFQLAIEVDEWYVDLEQTNLSNQWFDLELGIIIDKQKISLMTILQQILKTKFSSIKDIEALTDDTFVSLTLENGTPISVLGSRIKPILKMLVELHVEKEGKAVFFKDKAKELSELKHILGEKSIWTNADQLDKAIQKIQNLHKPSEVSPPSSLQAHLRPYQQQGLNWLQALREYQFGGILADDMGLGKTLQALTHLLLEKESGRMHKPSIVITPTSLVSNWKAEASKFTPGFKIHVHHGLDRKATPVKFEDYDVIITTYPLLVRDQEQLLLKNFYYIVLDEAQTIKNSHF